jgi:hypothetical protein
VQIPEQQSVPTLHVTPVSWHGRSQKPAAQKREQHCALAVQARPVDWQMGPPSRLCGGAHLAGDPVQRKLQHSAFPAHVPPSAAHGI